MSTSQKVPRLCLSKKWGLTIYILAKVKAIKLQVQFWKYSPVVVECVTFAVNVTTPMNNPSGQTFHLFQVPTRHYLPSLRLAGHWEEKEYEKSGTAVEGEDRPSKLRSLFVCVSMRNIQPFQRQHNRELIQIRTRASRSVVKRWFRMGRSNCPQVTNVSTFC